MLYNFYFFNYNIIKSASFQEWKFFITKKETLELYLKSKVIKKEFQGKKR